VSLRSWSSAIPLALVLVLGCSKPAPREATDAELAPVDVDTNGQPIHGPATPAPALTPAPARPEPPVRDASQPRESDKAAQPQPPTDGPIVTVLYVCEIGTREKKRPAVVVFSSDPECVYLNERPRPSRILKPVNGWKISQLLADLKRVGLDTLPREDQPLDQRIEGDRQILIIRDGKRIDFKKSACQLDAKLWETFAKCEHTLVFYSSGSDTFVETEGLAPIPGH
jgi:hypothetical protein